MVDMIIKWLLEDENPAVKYRTQTELLGLFADKSDAKSWVFDKLPENWFETKGLWYRYYVTAIAECGLSSNDVPNDMLDKAFFELDKCLIFLQSLMWIWRCLERSPQCGPKGLVVCDL